jgi:hypothetical protein
MSMLLRNSDTNNMRTSYAALLRNTFLETKSYNYLRQNSLVWEKGCPENLHLAGWDLSQLQKCPSRIGLLFDCNYLLGLNTCTLCSIFLSSDHACRQVLINLPLCLKALKESLNGKLTILKKIETLAAGYNTLCIGLVVQTRTPPGSLLQISKMLLI